MEIFDMGSISTRKHEMELWYDGTNAFRIDIIGNLQFKKSGKGEWGSNKLKLILAGSRTMGSNEGFEKTGDQHGGISINL